MAVTIINNQPIRFRNADSVSEDCDCSGQRFCQLVNNTDETQFQIKASNAVTNGDFTTDLTGWAFAPKIVVTAITTNESQELECDGTIEITATGGTAPYTYSINGGAFTGDNTSGGECQGDYIITVKDSLGNEGSLVVTIFTNIICEDYQGATIQDLIDDGIILGQLYNCTLDDLQP
jgi:hypothetical protein